MSLFNRFKSSEDTTGADKYVSALAYIRKLASESNNTVLYQAITDIDDRVKALQIENIDCQNEKIKMKESLERLSARQVDQIHVTAHQSAMFDDIKQLVDDLHMIIHDTPLESFGSYLGYSMEELSVFRMLRKQNVTAVFKDANGALYCIKNDSIESVPLPLDLFPSMNAGDRVNISAMSK